MKMKKQVRRAGPSARDIVAAACSVVGARNAGVTTAASLGAPALLLKAEDVLCSLLDHVSSLEPSAPDEADEQRYFAAQERAAAYMEAVDELRAALGLETRAAARAAENAAKAQAAREQRAQRAALDAEREVAEAARSAALAAERAAAAKAEFAAAFAAAWEDTVRRFGECYDQYGQRVALVVTISYTSGRMSSLGGWDAGGDECGRSEMLLSETGRSVESGEWVSTRSNYERQVQGTYLALAGCMCAPATSASSTWLPGEPVAQKYSHDWDCQECWEDAFAAKKSAKQEVLVAKKSAKQEVLAAASSPFAALAALKQRSA